MEVPAILRKSDLIFLMDLHAQGGKRTVYKEIHLKLLNGRTVAIGVEPGFDVDDLEYLPGVRAVSLGNLTVLYEGLVYDVRPSRGPGPTAYARPWRTL